MTGHGNWKARSVPKKRTPRLKPTLWDGVVALCVAGLACAILLGRWRGGAAEVLTAVVYADGAEIDRVRLSTDTPLERAYACNGYTLHAAFSTDGVQVLDADCPTQDCVHTGVITHSGQSIVCLPARIVIRLEGGAIPADAPDAVLG
ncbi:MAG: NusG domain II-containing protein [Oscillibacter sp.]|nr:NusG domain II-containing protein [Oscillibacter sp.]